MDRDASDERFVVEFDWASALPAPELPRHVWFERAWMPKLRQAATSFRQRSKDNL
jgi:hypothetical protein